MMRIIQNLRIGTKLAFASALTLLLVAGMIYLQITGGNHVHEASEAASRQQSVATNAGEAKASVRGMQLGTREIVLASNPAEPATQEDAPKDSQEQSATYAAGRPYVLPRACWRSPRTQRHTTVIA